MSTYDKVSKNVYDFLIEERMKSGLNFSLRQRASKGAEYNYFIGKKRSGYFGTTFWNIPVSYPGSSVDLIDLIVFFDKKEFYNYKIQFYQTKNPHDKQNKFALRLIQEIKPEVTEVFKNVKSSDSKSVMEFYSIQSNRTQYSTVNEMMVDAILDLLRLQEIVDSKINSLKLEYPKFIAEKISDEMFNKMNSKLKKRLGNKSSDFEEEATSNDGFIEINDRNPKNLILFGPPGTGKTYSTINHAISIIEGISLEDVSVKYNTRSSAKERFDQLLIKDWENPNGQIGFVTFHQSMSYEDFIEGIKPVLGENDNEIAYSVEHGIFRRICTESAFSFVNTEEDGKNNSTLNFSTIYDDYVENLDFSKNIRIELSTLNGSVFIDSISSQGNLILSHKDSSRVYTVSKKRLGKLFVNIDDLKKVKNIQSHFRSLIGGCNASAYWAVLNVLKSQKNKGTGSITRDFSYDDKLEAIKQLNNIDYEGIHCKPFVLIIDEINRGNISQIFGELITLIESNKRLGTSESLEVVLPYSKEVFGVPKNLYIIGTMNTADRSVEALDTALRRRFVFKEMNPDYETISVQRKIWDLFWDYNYLEWEDPQYMIAEKRLFELIGLEGNYDKKFAIWEKMELEGENISQVNYFNEVEAKGIDCVKILKAINSRIERLLDKDHLIGHSYLMKVNSKQELIEAFKNEIIPLLQEYFYGDIGKIGLILGDTFININDNDNVKLWPFKKYDNTQMDDFESKLKYEFLDSEKWDFKSIYE